MAWSKAGETTQAWVKDTSGGNWGTYNAWNGGGTGVLQEVVAFMETRGWVTSSYASSSPDASTLQHDWKLYKDSLTESGAIKRIGFHFVYAGKTSGNDQFTVQFWNQAADEDGRTFFSTSISEWEGKWSFWTSDQDNESYLILAGDGSNSVVGFQPPAGSTFNVGYYNSDYPMASGIAPIHLGAGPAFNGYAAAVCRPMQLQFAAEGITDLGNTREKLDFVWVQDDYGAPMWHIEGGDISMELDYSKGADVGPSNNSYQITSVVKYGSNYYIAIGSEQRLLFDCGPAPVF